MFWNQRIGNKRNLMINDLLARLKVYIFFYTFSSTTSYKYNNKYYGQ